MPHTGANAGRDFVAAFRDSHPRYADEARYPIIELGRPGAERERKVEDVLAGRKRVLTALRWDYDYERLPLPQVGGRELLVDSQCRVVAAIETTIVTLAPFAKVNSAHGVLEDGEVETLEQWREGMRRTWDEDEYRERRGDPDFELSADEIIVVRSFLVAERFDPDTGVVVD